MRTNDVLIVIFEGIRDRVLYRLEPGKMHDGRAAILPQHILKRSLIADITLNRRQRLSANFLDTLQSHRAAIGKIVENHDLFAG